MNLRNEPSDIEASAGEEQSARRQAALPDVDEAERSRRREALMFMSRLEEEAERAKQQPATSPSIGGVASAAVGLAGLVLAHAISGMTNAELAGRFRARRCFCSTTLARSPEGRAPLRCRQGWAGAMIAALLGVVAAQPLGRLVQKHYTTFPDVRFLRLSTGRSRV